MSASGEDARWRCDEHQGTLILDRPPMEREVCWDSEFDELDLRCRWVVIGGDAK